MNQLIEFIFPRRLHRLDYFFRGLVFDVLPPLVYLMNPGVKDEYFITFYIALVIYSLFFIILPRIRDVGMSGWWLLACFIPLVGILLGVILLFRAPNFRSRGASKLAHAPQTSA